MKVRVDIINKNDRKIPFNRRLYRGNSTRTHLFDLNEYLKYEEYKGLDTEIIDIIYEDIENLNLDELRFVAKHKNVENYWSKNKDTLINEIKKPEPIKLEGKVNEDTKNSKRGED